MTVFNLLITHKPDAVRSYQGLLVAHWVIYPALKYDRIKSSE